ncbi:AAA family ATPase [Nitrosospira multiformis]|uniref:Exonuclease SbcC n=1 Tax=Nitrosospira multiformis TaxID=1231 RepID=A0A1I7GA10_9PROT|nr:AAA family ATPase [Nitrosospira multiformis]SFU45106.1 exonuclease SbcC [Nitrosospira multiformis]
MKILQVRFKNLNSLVGEWEIDLTHPAFTSDGIFAIAGPTGAGKTTILDAICLALYGRTPRLSKVTKSGNEIMSRQIGECFAEVTFETQTGRFRCHWSQHRARKKPDGELQAPRHEIAHADSGEILESKIKGVAEQIEAATGMDFDQFTRSMLLAQGGFAAFLQALPDERAPILEQITGTEIYSKISIRVHERQREEREKLNLLQAETAGIVILEQEQEKDIQQELESKQKEESGLTRKLMDTDKAITWVKAVDGLRKEIDNLTAEASKLQADIDIFKPELDKLSRAIQAVSLEGSYATLTAIRTQHADEQKALKTGEAALPELAFSEKEQAESLKSAEQQSTRTKAELEAALPLIRKVRSLDQTLADQKKAISKDEDSCRKDAIKIDADKQAKLKEQGKRADAEKNLKVAEDYLKENAQDEWLISGLAGVEEQLDNLFSRQKEIAQKEAYKEKAVTALEQATRKLAACRRQCGARKQELENTSKNLQQGKDKLSQLLGDRQLREYRTEKETLLREMVLLKKIAELEDHRAKLEDGKPCPLCGATEHPFAEGNVPIPDEIERKIGALTELISKAEDHETTIRHFEEAEGTARKNLMDGEKQEITAVNDKKTAEQALAELKECLEKLQTDITGLKQAVSAKLQPLGIVEIRDSNVLSLLESLRERVKAWQTQIKRKTDIEKQIGDFDSQLKRLEAVIETQSNALNEKREYLESLKKDYAAGCKERKELYGDKNPDDEELRLKESISISEEAEKKASVLYADLQQKLNTAKAQIDSLKKRIGQRDPELKELEAEFTEALELADFSDEKQFLEARLTVGQRDALSAKARKLDDHQIALKARQKDRESHLATEAARKITDKSLEELEPQFKDYEESLKQLRDTIIRLKHRLNENAAAKERLEAKQTAIEAQKMECRRWENLHELIGSADGKKYRNFAQGLTFEMMIGHANRQLQKMTDRYLLVRDDTQPLELNVVDNYQAGEIRSTKNLSGGESFIVSLSLALGLSHMASKNVRVDSLFLDEGFGTLDEEALDTALETLASLQQDGKLIGVISHVPTLKERISTQILVIPQSGGRSEISGPGCRRNLTGQTSIQPYSLRIPSTFW